MLLSLLQVKSYYLFIVLQKLTQLDLHENFIIVKNNTVKTQKNLSNYPLIKVQETLFNTKS